MNCLSRLGEYPGWYRIMHLLNGKHSVKSVLFFRKIGISFNVSPKCSENFERFTWMSLKQFESGKGNPTLQTLQKIADVLGLEVSLKLKDVTRNQ